MKHLKTRISDCAAVFVHLVSSIMFVCTNMKETKGLKEKGELRKGGKVHDKKQEKRRH